jgi:hypothetical protein
MSMKADILKKAIKFYGAERQTDKAIEEMAELVKEMAELIKQLLKNRYEGDDSHVVEELADVLVTANELTLIFGVDRVLEIVRQKEERLANRMEEELAVQEGAELIKFRKSTLYKAEAVLLDLTERMKAENKEKIVYHRKMKTAENNYYDSEIAYDITKINNITRSLYEIEKAMEE